MSGALGGRESGAESSSGSANSGAGGGFRHDTWWIHTPGDNPRAAQYASAHESHHRQLEATTAFGNLTRVAVRLSRIGAPVRPTLVADLVGASRAVHEAFASWVPAFVLGWTRDDIMAIYPEYSRDYDAMDSLVGAAGSPYLRLHLAHAVARLCMQADVLKVAARVGFADLRLADIRNVERPDSRLQTLRRRPPSVARIEAEMDALSQGRATGSGNGARIARQALDLFRRPDLTADMLAPGERDVFAWVNLAVYTLVAEHASSLRLEALGHEEHVAAAVPVLAAAREFAGVEIDLVSGGVTPSTVAVTSGPDTGGTNASLLTGLPSSDPRRFQVQTHARRAVGSVDYEQFSVASPLEATWLGSNAPLREMVAGLEDPHLFLAVRTLQQIRENYRHVGPGAPSDDSGVAFVRRTVTLDEVGSADDPRAEDGPLAEPATVPERVIELLDVTHSMPARSAVPAPVVTSVAMSLLGTPVVQRLAEYLHTKISTLLVDVPLEPHLNLWLSSPGARVRWLLLRTEGHGRVVPVLILRVENDGGRSHLMIKPVSHAAAGIFRAGFEEVDPSGEHLVADPGLLDDDPELLQLTMSHLVGEEVWFGGAG